MAKTDILKLLHDALALHQTGKLAEAETLYQAVLELSPDHFDATHLLGLVRKQQGRHDEAYRLITAALKRNPESAFAWSNRGVALFDLKRPEDAVASYDKAIALKPDYAEAYNNRGNALRYLKRSHPALASYDRAIALNPDYAEAYFNRGIALQDLKRPEDAAANYDKAIILKPDDARAYKNLGIALRDLKRPHDALSSYDKAIALKPDYAEAYFNRGIAFKDLERPEDALSSYDKAIALKPDYAEAYINRGNVLKNLNHLEDALSSYDKAIALKPDCAEAYFNRGIALQELKRLEDALSSYAKAIALKPNYAEAHINRGNALYYLKRLEDALASYDTAIALKTGHAEVHFNRGNALFHLKLLDDAARSYQRALDVKADYFDALAWYVLCSYQICAWRDVEHSKEQLLAKCQLSTFHGPTFPVLAICDDPAVHRAAAEVYVRNKAVAGAAAPLRNQNRHRQKIRLGYLSADFRHHPVALLIAELIELHDRSRFEVHGFSVGCDDHSAMRKRLEGAFDVFVEAQGMSDEALAKRVREAEIDILIDLGGHTTDGRILALAQRPAPIQVTYLGYPASTGAEFIDYVIADRFVVPWGGEEFFTEKLAYLPDCFLVNDRRRAIAERTPSRAESSLPDRGFIFCCFNNAYKLNSAVFDIWMRLLSAVPDSVLWLKDDNKWAQENLWREAQKRGVDANRLVFAPHVVSYPDHLARLRLADLFLDTWPYNAATTASDALWVGLPVLTCAGRSYAARMAGSLLNAVGLPELVADSAADYETLALKLATQPKHLRELRQKLQHNKATTPLFDTDRFRRHIEVAYMRMWETHQRGERPSSFHVEIQSST